MSEYRKLADVLRQLTDEKVRLEQDIKLLRRTEALPDMAAFDEQAGAERIMAARTADMMDGANTAEAVRAQIDKEREQHNKQRAARAKEKQAACEALAPIVPQLEPLRRQIEKIQARLNELFDNRARERLNAAREKYRNAVITLMDELFEIEAIYQTLPETNKNITFRNAIGRIPNPGITLPELWHDDGGTSCHIRHDVSLKMYQARKEALKNEIEGELYNEQ